MKIYISDKEIDDNGLDYVEDDFVEEYWLSRGMSQGKSFEVFDDVGLVEIQSLEQHEAEIRKQERQKVIADLEEWIKENHKDYICRTQTNHLQGKSFSPHMVGASISVYLDTFKGGIDQKIKEMKEVRDEN